METLQIQFAVTWPTYAIIRWGWAGISFVFDVFMGIINSRHHQRYEKLQIDGDHAQQV